LKDMYDQIAKTVIVSLNVGLIVGLVQYP